MGSESAFGVPERRMEIMGEIEDNVHAHGRWPGALITEPND
jgi:hypothetical protein